jgi:hypothetical protein
MERVQCLYTSMRDMYPAWMLSECIACNFVFHLAAATGSSLRRQLFDLFFCRPLLSSTLISYIFFPCSFMKHHRLRKQLKYTCVQLNTIFLILRVPVLSLIFIPSITSSLVCSLRLCSFIRRRNKGLLEFLEAPVRAAGRANHSF